MRSRHRIARAASCALGIAAAIGFSAVASAQVVQPQSSLDFGLVPPGSELTVAPTDARAAVTIVSFDGEIDVDPPCTAAPVTFEFIALPADGDPVAFSAASGRIEREDGTIVVAEFHPAGPPVQVEFDDFPVIVRLGGVGAPDEEFVGLYEDVAELQVSYPTQAGQSHICNNNRHEEFSEEIEVILAADADLTVTAHEWQDGDIPLLAHGDRLRAPADGSGDAQPALFMVEGPVSFDYKLTVIPDESLEHVDVDAHLPLTYTGCLWSSDASDGETVGDGFSGTEESVSYSLHGGNMRVACGFEIGEVPANAAQGHYRGEIVLTVEVRLQ